MRWSYADLMELPAALYPELIDWLNETQAATAPDTDD